MNAYLANHRESLRHFSQQTYIWIIRFANAHMTQSSKERGLIYLKNDQSGVLIFKNYHFMKENPEPHTERLTVPLDLSPRVYFPMEKEAFACLAPRWIHQSKESSLQWQRVPKS